MRMAVVVASLDPSSPAATQIVIPSMAASFMASLTWAIGLPRPRSMHPRQSRPPFDSTPYTHDRKPIALKAIETRFAGGGPGMLGANEINSFMPGTASSPNPRAFLKRATRHEGRRQLR